MNKLERIFKTLDEISGEMFLLRCYCQCDETCPYKKDNGELCIYERLCLATNKLESILEAMEELE